ncbi:MAG TPA: RDD family protein [Pseudomonadales bacterium]|nr:RDD family protein [Pseudomonadales bacterium]
MTHTTLPSAGLGRRLAALVYDGLLLAAVYMVIGAIWVAIFQALLGHQPESGLPRQLTLFPLLVLVTYGYYGWCWKRTGQTLGMKTWGIRVETIDLPPQMLDWGRTLRRMVAGALNWLIFGTGYLLLYFNDEKLTLVDQLSSTRVVLVPRQKK